jgi:hypothetical protein
MEAMARWMAGFFVIPCAAAAFAASGCACPEPVYGSIRRRPVLDGLINDYTSAA